MRHASKWRMVEAVSTGAVAGLAAIALAGSAAATIARVALGAVAGGLAVLALVELRRLDRLAHHDPLTSVLNRRGLARRVARGARAEALVLVDLDRFKELNDRMGHAAGDRALVHVARVLARHGTAARLGGDELVVLVDDAGVADTIADEVRVAGQALGLPLSVSVGVTPLGARPLAAALEEADRAMFVAKRGVARRDLPTHERRARRASPRERTPSGPIAAAALMIALAAPTLAEAQHQRGGVALHDPPPPPPPGPVRFELVGGSLAPIDSGFTARLVIADAFFLSAGVGLGTYGEAAAGLASAFGASAEGAALAHDAWSGLFGLHLSAGFRLPGLGLELSGGYALLSHGTRLWAETFGAALGEETTGTWVRAAMLLHAYTVELGWTFRLLDHFLFRPAIGWLQVLDAAISLDDEGTSYADQSLDALAEQVTGYAETWGMTPTLSVQVGYAF